MIRKIEVVISEVFDRLHLKILKGWIVDGMVPSQDESLFCGSQYLSMASTICAPAFMAPLFLLRFGHLLFRSARRPKP